MHAPHAKHGRSRESCDGQTAFWTPEQVRGGNALFRAFTAQMESKTILSPSGRGQGEGGDSKIELHPEVRAPALSPPLPLGEGEGEQVNLSGGCS